MLKLVVFYLIISLLKKAFGWRLNKTRRLIFFNVVKSIDITKLVFVVKVPKNLNVIV